MDEISQAVSPPWAALSERPHPAATPRPQATPASELWPAGPAEAEAAEAAARGAGVASTAAACGAGAAATGSGSRPTGTAWQPSASPPPTAAVPAAAGPGPKSTEGAAAQEVSVRGVEMTSPLGAERLSSPSVAGRRPPGGASSVPTVMGRPPLPASMCGEAATVGQSPAPQSKRARAAAAGGGDGAQGGA